MCFIKYCSFSVLLGHCDTYVRHFLLPVPGVGMHLPTLYNNTVAQGLRVTAVKLLKYHLHTANAQILSVQSNIFLPMYC